MNYYKIIYSGNIIDAVADPVFYKYLIKSKRLVVSDPITANCIQGSNNAIYGIRGKNFPPDFPYKKVIYSQISQSIYEKLKQDLVVNSTISSATNLQAIKTSKIEELKTICGDKIKKGITITLSDKKEYTFELTLEDQLNLQNIESMLVLYPNGFPYHAKDLPAQIFTQHDLKVIIAAAKRHIQFHTLYFNISKYLITNMNSLEAIEQFKYGTDLRKQTLPQNLREIVFEVLYAN